MESAPAAASRNRRIASVALPLAAIAVLFAFSLLVDTKAMIPDLCLLHRLTGLHCATCGATRATQALFRGDIASAFDLNPLYVASLPLLAYLAVAGWLRLLPAGIRLPLPRSWGRTLGLAIAVMVVFMVARNLPGPAFSWLAP